MSALSDFTEFVKQAVVGTPRADDAPPSNPDNPAAPDAPSQQLVGAAPVSAATQAKPSISVSAKDTASGGEFTITGWGFIPNKKVCIRVVDDFPLQNPTLPFQGNADGNGGLKKVVNFRCNGGKMLHFSATSEGSSDPNEPLLKVMFSNTFDILCPATAPAPSKGDDDDDGGDGDGSSGGGDRPADDDNSGGS